MRAGKWMCGSVVGFWGLLAPVQVLILCVCVAIIVDFITGNIADYKRHKRAHQKYVFKSEKMWDTCWKLGLSIIGIGMAYMLDVHVKHVCHTNTNDAEPQLPTRVPHFLAFEHIFLMGSFVALVVSNISSYEVDDYGNTDTKNEDLDRGQKTPKSYNTPTHPFSRSHSCLLHIG